MAPVRAEDLVFLDETGSHLGYTPAHARAPRGQRAYATAPANRGENKTVVAALTLEGVGPVLRFDGAMTTARFEGYVRFRLAPTLRPGQVVIADNLTAHHSPVVRAAIEARGARFLPLPASSPDFNPIEEAFSKVKGQAGTSAGSGTHGRRPPRRHLGCLRYRHLNRRRRLVHPLRLSTP